jgi:hypothetical protein
MTPARYAYGLICLALTLGSTGYAAGKLRSRLAPALTGPSARLADATVALGLLITLSELLGAFGLFRLGPLLAGALLLAGVSAAGRGVRQTDVHGARVRISKPAAGWMTAAVMTSAGAVAAEWLTPTLAGYDTGIRSFDSLWYHLPWAASFAQTGNVASLRFTDVEYLTSFYPASGELLHALGIVLLGRDTLSPGINLVFLALTLLAAWCIGDRFGAGAVTMMGAALALAMPMARFSQAGSAANDVVGIFFLLAAAALLLRAEESLGVLLLAGLSAGLAVSVKLSLLAPAVLLMLVALALCARRRSAGGLARLRPWAWTLLAFAIGGGYWYARNLVLVGNPLPWLGPLPKPAAPLQQHTGFAIAHYIAAGTGWRRWFQPGLASGLGPWWPAVLAAAVAGPVACLWRARSREARLIGLVALASIAAYLVTPESAAGPPGMPSGFAFNLRYALPALTLSLAAGGLAVRTARERAAASGALALLLVATLAEPRLWPGGYSVAAAAIVVLAAGAVAALRYRVRLRPATAVAILTPLAFAAAAAGYAGQRHYLDRRYVYQPHVSSLATLWQWFRGVHRARVAVAGTFGGFFSYPLYGTDLSNRVQYIGRRGAHGSFGAVTTCTGWREALAAGDYRYVVATPARNPWRPTVLQDSPEAAWTESDPAARLVFRQAAHGQSIDVFELSGSAGGAGCPPEPSAHGRAL